MKNIKGFNKLSPTAARLFEQFYHNFTVHTDENVVPIRVTEHRDHLKFYYKKNGMNDWLHVKGPNTWY